MKNLIQFTIKKEEKCYFTAKSEEYAIVAQGKTFEEIVENICEATKLHFEDLKEINGTFDISITYNIPIALYKR